MMSGNPELRYELVRDGKSVEIRWRPERRFAVAGITLGLHAAMFGSLWMFLPEWRTVSLEERVLLGAILFAWFLFVLYGLVCLLAESESIRLESSAVRYTPAIGFWRRTKEYWASEIRDLCVGQWSGRLGTGPVGIPYTLSAVVFDYGSLPARLTKWMDYERAAMIVEEIRRYSAKICAPAGAIARPGAETAHALTTVKLN